MKIKAAPFNFERASAPHVVSGQYHGATDDGRKIDAKPATFSRLKADARTTHGRDVGHVISNRYALGV